MRYHEKRQKTHLIQPWVYCTPPGWAASQYRNHPHPAGRLHTHLQESYQNRASTQGRGRKKKESSHKGIRIGPHTTPAKWLAAGMIASPRSHREQPRTPPRVPTSTAHMYRTPAAAGLHPWSLHDNTPASPSLDLLDQNHLVDQFFDFEGYYGPSRSSTIEPFPYPSPPRSLPRSSPRSSPGPLMNDFITDFPPVVNDRRGNFDPYGMASSSYGPDGLSSGSDYAATPELVTGGSSPSSATSVDQYDQYGQYLPTGSQDFRSASHDKWSHLPEDPRAVYHDYHSPQQDDHHHYHRRASESASLKRRHSGHGSDKRSRHLADRDKTADVRKSGACLPCRVLKTSVRHVVLPGQNRCANNKPPSALTKASVPRVGRHFQIMRIWYATV